MPATRPVPRAVRRGVLMALLVLTAVFAVALSAGGTGAGAVEPRTLSAAESMGGGAGESQPSDTADSESRAPGGGARSRKVRALVRNAAHPCPRTPSGGLSARAGSGPAPAPPRTVRCAVLRCVVLRC
ncbi:hypothetical protein [Streptomyces sp. A5-4]|uniref:hypothetical protein n=1 Tax=Streptomyces sp. A5-4 TaxID=3384771 RepID=UPI003DA80287